MLDGHLVHSTSTTASENQLYVSRDKKYASQAGRGPHSGCCPPLSFPRAPAHRCVQKELSVGVLTGAGRWAGEWTLSAHSRWEGWFRSCVGLGWKSWRDGI